MEVQAPPEPRRQRPEILYQACRCQPIAKQIAGPSLKMNVTAWIFLHLQRELGLLGFNFIFSKAWGAAAGGLNQGGSRCDEGQHKERRAKFCSKLNKTQTAKACDLFTQQGSGSQKTIRATGLRVCRFN